MSGESFGQALRRTRTQAGKSLRRLAAVTGFDYTYLSKVENGQQPGSVDLAEACDQALNADGALVARFAAPDHPEDLASMLRRTFLAGSAGLLAASAFSAAAATGNGWQVSADTVADLRTVAASYRRAYRAVPASHLLATAQAHLELAMSLRPAQQTEPVRVQLVSVVGEMAALGSVLCLFDLGKPDACVQYLNVAWQAARAIESVELQAVLLGGRSFVAAYGPGAQHREGLEYAEMACEVAAGGACAETRGWVAAVASERHASLGDLAACQQRMDESRLALDQAADDDREWLGLGGFDAAKLLAYEGGNLVRLRQWAAAEPVLDAAVGRFGDDMVRHRCTALLDRAEAHMGAGDVDATCVDARAALTLAAEVQHAQNLNRLDMLARRAAETGAAAAVVLRRELLAVKADTAGVLTMGG